MALYLNQVPPATAWLSPALTVVKSADLDQDAATPILDVDPVNTTEFQYAQAVAGNDDPNNTTYSNVHVQIWAYAVATAVPSGLYLNSMGGAQGVLIPAGGSGQIDIGPGQQQPFTRNWDATYGLTSDDAQIVQLFQNEQVHCCLLGNVFQAGDPASAEIPAGPNPISQLNVATNRHHAQHNMTIVKHPPGASLAFAMFAGNPDPRRHEVFTVHVDEQRPDRLQPWELDRLAALGPWIRRTTKRTDAALSGLEVLVDRKPQPVHISRKALGDLEVDIRGAEAGKDPRVELGADEPRRMLINATMPNDEFAVRVVDVVQKQGDRVMGGVRLLLMAAPKALLKPHKRTRG